MEIKRTQLNGCNLYEDLIIDILARVPVKSLMRFKSVCKSWYELISSPSFISTHHHQQKGIGSRSIILSHIDRVTSKSYLHQFAGLFDNEKSYAALDLPSFICELGVTLYGPVNGVFCIKERKLGSISAFRLVLWNPATRETKILPNIKPRTIKRFNYELVHFEMSYDTKTNDWYLMGILFKSSKRSLKTSYVMRVCTRSCNTWKVVGPKCPKPFHDGFFESVWPGTLKNGNCYWCFVDEDENEMKIAWFGMVDKKVGVIELPDVVARSVCEPNRCWVNLMVVDDCLAVVVNHRCQKERFLDLWVMKSYNSWTHARRVGPLGSRMFVLGFFKNTQLVRIMKGHEEMYLYDPSTHKEVRLPGRHKLIFPKPYVYSESLFSFKLHA